MTTVSQLQAKITIISQLLGETMATIRLDLVVIV